MIEVGTEQPIAHALLQVAVGGGDDAHIHPARLVGAQPLDFAVLQGAQQLGLDAQRQLAHLVEEQRAAIGRLEPPRPLAGGTGKGALGVAEQFAFGQGFGQRRAVHMHQRLVATWRMAVQPAREQLLADAGFAQQQYRQFGLGHHLQFMQQGADRLAAPEQFALHQADVLLQHLTARQAQAAVLMLQAGDADRRFDQQGAALQVATRRIIEGANMQRIEGQRAPQATFHIQALAHAIVHRQRIVLLTFQQPVVGVRQPAARLEPGRFALGEDGRQPRMPGHHEAPAQRLAHQPGRRHRQQAVVLQAQQHHRAAAKALAQGVHQALQAHGVRQFGGQVDQQTLIHHGD